MRTSMNLDGEKMALEKGAERLGEGARRAPRTNPKKPLNKTFHPRAALDVAVATAAKGRYTKTRLART